MFLLSTTHGAENHALAAARAVIRTFREQPVIDHMWRIGGLLLQGLNDAARAAGVAGHFKAFGFRRNPGYTVTDATGARAGLRTLFMQEMVKAGVLIPYIAPALAHSEADVARTVEAARPHSHGPRGLDGDGRNCWRSPVKPVFREFN